MKSKTADTDGTIIEFLNGSHSYEGVWFGDKHRTKEGTYWWRKILRDYVESSQLQPPVPDEAPKEWEEQATKDYENGYESETSAIDKFMVADEAGEVYVWVKDEPSKDVNETFVCMIEKRGDGEVTQKPAYAQWLYSQWITEEGWKVIEWLSPAPPSGEDAGKGWISVEDRLPTEKDADENGKVLVYRNTNEGQKGLSKSIFDYFMVKNCDSDTVWQPLPPKP